MNGGVYHPISSYLLGGQAAASSSPPAVASGILDLNDLINGPGGSYTVTLGVSTACKVINASTTFIILARLLNFQPFNVGCLGNLTQNGNNITRVLYAYTLRLANGYELNAFLDNVTTTAPPGQLQVELPSSPSLSVGSGSIYAENNTAYVSGTTYPSGSVSNLTLWSGSYTLNESLTFDAAINTRTVLLGNYSYQSQSGYINETILPVTGNVMNLLNGVSKFYVKHIYQGDFYGFNISYWPQYYNVSYSPPYYWYNYEITQPILELSGYEYIPTSLSAGIMLWQETYHSGITTIRVIGTYSSGTYPPGGWFRYISIYKTTNFKQP